MLQKEECSFFLLHYEEFPNSIQKFLNTISMSKQHVMLANQIEIVHAAEANQRRQQQLH